MKIKIRLKIVFLGALLSLLVAVIATFASYYIYIERSKDDLKNSIANVLDNLNYDITTEEDVSEFLVKFKTRINNIYEADPDEPDFDTYDEKKDYYENKYSFMYRKQGMFGLSLDDLNLRNGFLSLQNELLDANVFARVKSVYIAYNDLARGRIVYLVDSRHGESNIEYYLPGSFYELSENDNKYDYGDVKVHTINGIDNLYKELYFKNEDNELEYIATIYVEYNEESILKNANSFLVYILIILASTALVTTILYSVISHFLISKNISKLNDSTELFTNNLINSNRRNELQLIDAGVKSKDEIGELSNNINSMETEILAYIKRIEEANRTEERINAELQVASKIQIESLPESVLENDRIRIDSFIRSAKEVGGDFYDYYYLDNDHIAIIISDVSGKGVPAALFMMKSKELIKSKLLSRVKLEKAFYDINNELLLNNDEGLFITSLVMVIDLNTLECNIINAGHEKPYLVRNGSATRMNIESNFILGGEENFEYISEVFKLEEGDNILLHTDGLNESINNEREEFGYQRIIDVLNNSKQSKDYIDDLNNALKEFTEGNEQFDDVTLLSINIKEKEFVIRCDAPSIDSIEEVTTKFASHFKELDSEIKGKVSIIIDDIINNYVTYEDLSTLKIEVHFKVSDNKLFITFINNGVEFNPLTVNSEKYEEYSDDLTPGGLGILIVKEMTDDISYERCGKLNKLSMSINLDK